MRFSMLRLRGSRATECWGALLLVALFARALIPTGFMPAATTGGLQLIVCQGNEAGIWSKEGGSAGSHIAGHDLSCPFFQSAVGGPTPTAPQANLFQPLALDSVPEIDSRYLPDTHPLRYSSPRGPPQFS